MTPPHQPTLLRALLPILFLITALGFNVFFVFKDSGLDGSNQIILLVAALVAGLLAAGSGSSMDSLMEGAKRSIVIALPSIFILLLIGSLIGAWMISGVIPTMIYYGVSLLNPTILLVSTCVICAIVSLGTGSSWSTVGTIGIALMAIGRTMGFSEGIVAGAILSGAYFGDKLSPLSDTTNLAAAVAETSLFVHIKYMLRTTIPSFAISLLFFLIMGFTQEGSFDSANIVGLKRTLEEHYTISLWLMLVPVTTFVLILRKVETLLSLLAGTALACILAAVFQPHLVFAQAEGLFAQTIAGYQSLMTALYGSFSITTDNPLLGDLLSSGGMYGMLNTVWLILCAMIFGGVMEASGFLRTITQTIARVVHSQGSAVSATAATCVFTNVTASDQYLSIVVPGRMFPSFFKRFNLAPENLSRTLEDSGTVTSALIPWNTCGAYHASILGVLTTTYAPWAVFNYVSPMVTVAVAYFGTLRKAQPDSPLDR